MSGYVVGYGRPGNPRKRLVVFYGSGGPVRMSTSEDEYKYLSYSTLIPVLKSQLRERGLKAFCAAGAVACFDALLPRYLGTRYTVRSSLGRTCVAYMAYMIIPGE
jgi:hypothetical protein